MKISLPSADTTCSFRLPNKPAGFWVLYPGLDTSTQFATYSRPTDEQIKNAETLLGWGWKEVQI